MSKQKITNSKKKTTAKKKRQQQIIRRTALCLICAVTVCVLAVNLFQMYRGRQAETAKAANQDGYEGKIPRPALDVELLTPNEYSRPGAALNEVKGVVIHYTANPGTSAIANRNYFEGLKDSHAAKASSHFIIGLEGEVVQCIPCSEISYASNYRNEDTVSIECCIEEDTGKFNQATYHAAVHLTAWLAERYGLKVSDVIRHYDVTGKECPKYFVNFPAAWDQFLADVQAYLDRYGV